MNAEEQGGRGERRGDAGRQRAGKHQEQKRKKTRGHGDARTRGAAGHTDLRTEISRVGGNLEPRVLVSASSPLRVSPEGTLRTWAPGHLCTEHLLTPHSHCL
ncbi:MAG: hypothetical protein BRC36_14900 [Cyanobacteria bacterium QH_2_48_84]|nr:MAG: hypothetical protein BRC36_14900 [Cyanobacteria bacterium QH_2_48_84]